MAFTDAFNSLSELHKRIITGFLGGLIVLGGLTWNEWSYFALFFCICFFTLWEFYNLLGLDGNVPLRSFGTINGLFIFSITFFVEKYQLSDSYYMLCFIGLSGAYFIRLYVKRDVKPFADIAFTFLGVLYVAAPFAFFNFIVFGEGGSYSYQVILGILFLLWANDTGAYFSGRNFGKRKLFVQVSPKKTWEGSIGGALLSLAVGFVLSRYFQEVALYQWLCIAGLISVVGTYGDLVESLFKRSINIKDSGKVLPGHGGFLDRFDSLLLAAPFIVVFLKMSKEFGF
ncbi:MAG: phosphatidate cytidylyltransferase [Cytophagales bacterium]|nr:MAG: phosphatidate cytidylyltransferase [Cytophagales bacterium]TAF59427.1 MAG: phosphatidate cytidylyltransferase [Cytophagales bacterium]